MKRKQPQDEEEPEEVSEEEEEQEEGEEGEEEQGWMLLDKKGDPLPAGECGGVIKTKKKKMKKTKFADMARVQVTSRAALRRWLQLHHRTSSGIWLVTFKKNKKSMMTTSSRSRSGADDDDQHGDRHLAYADVVEELLCFGWIDGRAGRLDEARSMLHCSPRRAKSVWSALNKERVARLEADGLMTERGQEVVREAKESGQWDALNEVEALIVPDDLKEALEGRPGAREHWDAFPPSSRRAILQWITQAKRAETRSKRVEETARRAELNQRAK